MNQNVFQRKRDGKWFARVVFTDPTTGKKVDRIRAGRDEHHARTVLAQLIAEATGQAPEFPTAAPEDSGQVTTFRQLAAAYSQHKVRPAQYRNDRKIAGLRSERTVKFRIAALVSHFGDTDIRQITVSAIERFKLERLDTKTRNKKERSITAVNRELEILRTMLRFARNEGLIAVSPFERSSTPLISKADEVKRTRILTRDEERRLLAACVNGRSHLKPLIIAALDTGMRKGELLAITWADVSITTRTITVRALTTKTLTTRTVPLSNRLFAELNKLPCPNGDRSARIFPLTKFQNGWDNACEAAGITDLRFHDLRATFCTRLIEAGMPIEQVAKLSGHTQLSTLYAHYISNTAEAIQKAGQLLDSLNR